jgi:hypothetical protein
MRISIFFIIILFAISCKKESNNHPKPEDTIVFTEADTQACITTYRYTTPSPVPIFDCPDIPTPTDSSANLIIDIDQDSITDFRVRATHSEYLDGYCGHCRRFTYQISMDALEPGDSIRVAFNNYMAPVPEVLDTATDISQNGKWSNTALLVLAGGCSLPFNTSFTDMNLGVRKGNKFGWIHIRPKAGNGIFVLESAINLADNNSIKAGQKR